MTWRAWVLTTVGGAFIWIAVVAEGMQVLHWALAFTGIMLVWAGGRSLMLTRIAQTMVADPEDALAVETERIVLRQALERESRGRWTR